MLNGFFSANTAGCLLPRKFLYVQKIPVKTPQLLHLYPDLASVGEKNTTAASVQKSFKYNRLWTMLRASLTFGKPIVRGFRKDWKWRLEYG